MVNRFNTAYLVLVPGTHYANCQFKGSMAQSLVSVNHPHLNYLPDLQLSHRNDNERRTKIPNLMKNVFDTTLPKIYK
jgi:hypothetical protein